MQLFCGLAAVQQSVETLGKQGNMNLVYYELDIY